MPMTPFIGSDLVAYVCEEIRLHPVGFSRLVSRFGHSNPSLCFVRHIRDGANPACRNSSDAGQAP